MRESKVNIIFTTDVHGNFFPYDFRRSTWGKGSLQRVHAFVSQEVSRLPGSTILIDGGDLLQGSPAAYFLNAQSLSQPEHRMHRVADMCNYIGYDAGILGNHDIEMGVEVVKRFVKGCHFPILGANVIDDSTGECALTPYVLFQRGDALIALVGFITPAIPHWVPEQAWKGFHFDDITASARKWLAYLKQKVKPDYLVGLFHSGLEDGIVTPSYRENAVRITVEQVDGFDLVLYGHDHCPHMEEVEAPSGKEVICVNPGSEAHSVAEITITFHPDSQGRIIHHNTDARLCYIGRIANQHGQAFGKHFRRDFEDIRRWSSQKVGELQAPLDISDAFFGPSAYIDFIQQLQLQISGADISFSAPLFFSAHIPPGDLHISDLFNIYRFEDKLYTLRLSGQEIKDYLEMSYSLWTTHMQSPDDHLLLLSPMKSNPSRMGFTNFIFNFDAASGINYEVDVTQPEGHKLLIHSFSDGRPFRLDENYLVAMTAYRANGGGELLTKGARIAKEDIPQRIVSTTPHDVRHYLMQYVKEQGQVDPRPLGNWHFIPTEWTHAAAARDYDILFRHKPLA